MASPGDSSGAGAGSGSEPPPSGDLRSVLITSVLNLEQLEVDLFRCAWTPEQKRLTKIQAQDVPIDIKPVNPPDIFSSEPQEAKQLFWVRARGYIGETDMKVHCCVAAYISDYAFLGTALLPHRQYRIKFMVSLDHSMWFHAPFRADHWMLYECESPWACRGRDPQIEIGPGQEQEGDQVGSSTGSPSAGGGGNRQ
uniref:Acyl-CoA thioesterase 8 n=1 Tax=Ficedula albicollis TaxID=59894 RepID=A0A803VQJ6_FICAL